MDVTGRFFSNIIPTLGGVYSTQESLKITVCKTKLVLGLKQRRRNMAKDTLDGL